MGFSRAFFCSSGKRGFLGPILPMNLHLRPNLRILLPVTKRLFPGDISDKPMVERY
jgi:hypothetical protein